MKHMANDGTIFDKIEDCLRYEGACEGRQDKGGCGLFCLGALVFVFMLLAKMAEMA